MIQDILLLICGAIVASFAHHVLSGIESLEQKVRKLEEKVEEINKFLVK